jgi:hypothetical protein
VEIYSDDTFTTVLRTLSVTEASASYTTEQQADDFGEVQEEINVRIYQRSAIVGRGYPLTETLYAGPILPTSVMLYTGTGVSRDLTSYIDTRTGGVLMTKRLTSVATPNELIIRIDGVSVGANPSGTVIYSGAGAVLTETGATLSATSALNSTGTHVGIFLPAMAGLFEAVTWNGDGSGARDISHSIGYAPSLALVRRTDDSGQWLMYSSRAGADMSLAFPVTGGAAFASDTNSFPELSTSSVLKVGATLNASGESWMALMFSSDSPLVDEGTYTGNGSASGPTVSCGFRPQLLIIRSLGATARYTYLKPSPIDATSYSHWTFDDFGRAAATADFVTLSDTGFTISSSDGTVNQNAVSYQYIAIADWA